MIGVDGVDFDLEQLVKFLGVNGRLFGPHGGLPINL
jgi:hypothetical protein